MKGFSLTIVSVLFLLALVLTTEPVLAHDDPCIWNGSKSSVWSDKDNWDQCDGGAPQPHDDIQLGGGSHTPNIDSLDSDVVVHNVDLQGTQLWIDVGRSLKAQGTFTAQGGSVILNNGSIKGSVLIAPGTTIARGNFEGPVTILPGAKLEVVPDSALVFKNDLTISALGELSTLQGGSATFAGTTFTNNGTVNALVLFTRAGAQTIAGGGAWPPFSELRIGHESTTSLANSLTFQSHKLLVSSHGTLSLGTNTLVISGPAQLSLTGATVAGSGKLQTQGNVTIANSTVFSPTLDVTSGRVTANGTLNGPITVAKGATLTVAAANFVNATNELTLKGALEGGTFTLRGATFTNDGQVLNPDFNFSGAAQTLQGSGAFSSTTTAKINNGTALTLGSDHQMGKVTIHAGGKFDISNRTLSLSGAGTPLLNSSTFTTLGSTVVYNGAASQTAATEYVDYHNLTIDNSSGVTLPSAETVPGTLHLKNGSFAISHLLTMANRATIMREYGELNGTPNFGMHLDVEYIGLTGLTTGSEIPTSPTVLRHLKLDRPGGVTLGADATLHGRLNLAFGDLDAKSHSLTMTNKAKSKGDGDVIGNTKRTGPFAPDKSYSFGNRFVTLKFAAGGTLPSAVTVNLVKDTPSDFKTAVKRKYRVTPSDGSGYSATWRMHYQDGELNNNSEDTLQLWRYDDSAHRWIAYNHTASDTSDNWIERAGVTAFSPWTLANCYGKPSKPELLSPADGKVVAKRRVKLKWNSAICSDSYQLIVKQDSPTGIVVDKIEGLSATQYKTQTLAPGHTYFWKVTTRNDFGKKSSVWRSFTVSATATLE